MRPSIDAELYTYLGTPGERAKRGNGADEDVELLSPVSVATWRGLPLPEREWVWAGWLPRGHVVGLYGPPGVAKSTLAQTIATAVAGGLRLYGADTLQGPVLMLSCEDEIHELQRRELAIVNGLGCDYPSELLVESRLGRDSVLVTFGAEGDTESAVLRALRELLAGLRPVLLVLDVVTDFWVGSEINRHHVNGFVKRYLSGLAQDFNLCVLFLAHPSAAGIASGTGTSGSTAWEGSVRSRLYLARPVDDKGHPDLESDERILSLPKANYARAGAELRLKYQDGWLAPVALPGELAAQERAERCRAAFLDLAEWIVNAGRYISPAENSPAYFGKVFAKYQRVEGRRYDFTRREWEAAYGDLLSDRRVVSRWNSHAKRDELLPGEVADSPSVSP